MFLIFSLISFLKNFDSTEYENLNFYRMIGLEDKASIQDIKKSYKKFLRNKKHINDPSPKTKKYLETMDTIYHILGSNNSKPLYDMFGTIFLNLTDFKVVGYQSDEGLAGMNKMYPDSSTQMNNFGGTIYFPMVFDLEDFYDGVTKNATLVRVVECKCPLKKPKCEECKRNPFVDEIYQNPVTLPKGAPEFYRILAGQSGDTDAARGASDIIYIAQSKPHPIFERHGRDLYMNLTVPFETALKEDSTTFIGIDGLSVEISLEDAQDGKVVVIPNQGLPDFFIKNARGDLYVTLHIEFPKELTEEQKEKIGKLLPEDDDFYL